MNKNDIDNLLAVLKEIGTIVGIFATAIMVIYGGISGWFKSRAETRNVDVDTQTKQRQETVDLTNKQTDVNLKIIASLERRFDQLTKDFEEAKKELNHFKKLYEDSEEAKTAYRDIALRLLSMMKNGIKTRRTQNDVQCQVCENYDMGTLRILAEIEASMPIEKGDEQ